MNTFAERLTAIRKATRLTQENFAELLGVSTKTLVSYEGSTTLPTVGFLTTLHEITGGDLHLLILGKRYQGGTSIAPFITGPSRHHLTTFHERLRQERCATGFNQQKFGELGGVGPSSQKNYEAGRRIPDANYLMGVYELVDVPYILTGQRQTAEISGALLEASFSPPLIAETTSPQMSITGTPEQMADLLQQITKTNAS